MQRTEFFQYVQDAEIARDCVAAVKQHLEEYVGKISALIEEISDHAQPNAVSVAVIEPNAKKPHYTLCTLGLSKAQISNVEIMACLPSDWNLEELDNPVWNWPFNWLREIVGFAQTQNIPFSLDQTIPNGNPPETLASNTELCGFLIGLPLNFPGDFYQLKIDDKTCINFYSLIPLYEEEMQFTKSCKIERFYKKLFENRINEVIQIQRPNLCSRKSSSDDARCA